MPPSEPNAPPISLSFDHLIEGALNLRDVGPLPARDGRLVRPGRLFRSGMTHKIADAGLAQLAGELGIRTVIDLRTEREAEHAGTAPFSAHKIALHRAPMEDPADRDAEFRRAKLEAFRSGAWDWSEVYLRMASAQVESLARALRLIATEAELPVLIHCAAGRDRTGVLVALVLAALGVSPEVIAADYAKSGAFLLPRLDAFFPPRQPREGYLPLSREEMRRVLDTDANDMRRFLDALVRDHGSLDHYLDALGVDDSLRAALAARLLSD